MECEHFDMEAWIDFVRGVADIATQTAIRTHLSEKCETCTKTYNELARIWGAATQDAGYEPPESAVRAAKALFDRPLKNNSQTFGSVRVLFDSQLAPAPIGLRNGDAGPRRLVLASGGLVVDLQVPPTHDSGKVLVGQIKPRASDRSVNGLHVRLHDHRMRVVAQAATNRLGEFQMEFENQSDPLALVIWSDDYANVIQVIPLGAL